MAEGISDPFVGRSLLPSRLHRACIPLHVLYIIVRVLYICVLLCYRDVVSTKDPIDAIGFDPGRRERHATSTPVAMCCHEVMNMLV